MGFTGGTSCKTTLLKISMALVSVEAVDILPKT